jgi:hypothetical protein
MVYALTAVLGLVLALLALLAVSSRHKRQLIPRMPTGNLRPAPRDQLERLLRSGRYRGVRVESRCVAAQDIAGREFRFDQAPALPVSGCDATVCECGYTGLPERRVIRDRRSGRDRRSAPRAGTRDRRQLGNRRTSPESQWINYPAGANSTH